MPPRPSSQAVQLATMQLSVMLSAGVNIALALGALARGEDPRLAQVFAQVRREVEGGRFLSEALSRHPHVFPRVYLSSVRVGEKSGKLTHILANLARILERENQARSRLGAALVYPACVVVMAGLMLAFLLFVQVPAFTRMFEQTGGQLPFLTHVLMQVAQPRTVLVLGAIALVAALALRNVLRTEEGRASVVRRLYATPAIGPIFALHDLYRLTSDMAILLNSGVDLVSTLDSLSQPGSGSPYSGEVLQEVSRSIRAGASFPDALAVQGCYPRLFVQMIAVAEEHGALARGLERYAGLVDQELQHAIQTFTVLLEPLVMAVLGLSVMLIVVASFLPAYQLLNRLS